MPVQGYFNGFGGKVEQGETVTEAAHREVHTRPFSPCSDPVFREPHNQTSASKASTTQVEP